MSYIIAPDPYPGRCRNYRSQGTDIVRCLDYEVEPHICTFPPFPKHQMIGGNTTKYVRADPKPWVKP